MPELTNQSGDYSSDDLRFSGNTLIASELRNNAHLVKVLVEAMGGGPSLDSFGRWRVSNPQTIFDSKQIYDNQPLLWDESLETGAGITSSHSTDRASTTMTSTVSTAGKFTRQTFMRFNYQPGKSQLVIMTGILDKSGGGVGVQRRIGYFDDDNGIFFEDNANTINVTVRSSVTGSAVDDPIDQSDWNIDTLNGSGPSEKTVDWTKAQIFMFDFEWLGVGVVRLSLVIDGIVCPVHHFMNANNLTSVYMSTPNLPCRYQMITTSSSPASQLEAICSSVMSEGGVADTGTLRYKSTAGTHINANTADTIYAIVGLRLKSTALGARIVIENILVLNQAGDDFEWLVILNPTVASAVTFGNETNSSVQSAVGNTGNPSDSTLTGGTELFGGMIKGSNSTGSIIAEAENAILLGSAIDGTVDEIYLGVRPLSSNADIEGTITWRESP